MNMSLWEIVEDNYGFYQWFQVTYSDGSIFDLTDYGAALEIWSGEGGSRVVKATVNGVVDSTPSTGRVKFQVPASATDAAGEYSFHIKLTKTGVVASTDTYTFRVIEGAT
jgi:hypothetical protein